MFSRLSVSSPFPELSFFPQSRHFLRQHHRHRVLFALFLFFFSEEKTVERHEVFAMSFLDASSSLT